MKTDRRRFIKSMATAGGALLLSRVAGAAETEGEGLSWEDMGPAEDFPLDQPRVVAEKEVIVFRSQESVKALSARCTHSGCAVQRTSEGEFLCPCHDSKFDREGRAMAGPAEEPLPHLPAKLANGRVFVGKR